MISLTPSSNIGLQKELTPLSSFRTITSQRSHRYTCSQYRRGFHPFIDRREPFLMNASKKKNYAMKESIIIKKLPKIVFGLLFIGGSAFILGTIHAAKNIDRSYQQVF
jgi:hypothetical protein